MFRKFSGNESKWRKHRRKNGNDKEVSSRTLSLKANGTEEMSGCRRVRLKSTEAGVCKSKVSGAMWPLMALCHEKLGNGELVAGPWCSLIMMKRWGHCMGCMVQWRQSKRYSAPSRGRSWVPSYAYSGK